VPSDPSPAAHGAPAAPGPAPATAPRTAPVTVRTPEPGAAVRGGVVVLQEAFGITPYVAEVCDALAAAGWAAAAPHLFWRAGDPTFGYDDLATARELLGQLSADEVLSDTDDATAALLAQAGLPPARVAVLGFCIGGLLAFGVATRREVAAAVTFYGGPVDVARVPGFPSMTDAAGSLRAPWLGLYGSADAGIPVDSLPALRAAVPAPSQLHVSEGAQHGFHCWGRPSVYDAAAATVAWSRALAWLERRVPAA